MKHIATWIRECDEAPFARTFGVYPEVRLWNARTETVAWEQMQALLLTGGSDISESYLQQPVLDKELIKDPDLARDAWEFEYVEKALQQQLPILAICRGLQVLNVALGGTLHLDIPNHDNAKFENIQELRYVEGATIRISKVNSSHHQSLDHLGNGLVVEARHAEDGTVEQARLENYPFGLAVQYHPERDELYRPLFDAFVQQVEQGKA